MPSATSSHSADGDSARSALCALRPAVVAHCKTQIFESKDSSVEYSEGHGIRLIELPSVSPHNRLWILLFNALHGILHMTLRFEYWVLAVVALPLRYYLHLTRRCTGRLVELPRSLLAWQV